MIEYVASPTNPFTFHFVVRADGAERGYVRHRAFRPSGQAGWDGEELFIRRVAVLTFQIESASSTLATIRRAGPMRWASTLEWPGGSLDLQAPFFGYRTDMFDGGEKVGVIRLRTLLTRTLVAEAPDDVPAAAILLALWATVRRRRIAAGAAAGG